MPKMNNFDLIRLVAALQVAITHSIPLFVPSSGDSFVLHLVELFPGVPVFFFVSGFLISKSFEKNSSVREYALNRTLRIYPGLMVCFVVSLAMVSSTGYFSAARPSVSAMLPWVLGQLSFVQFYNPSFMRHYGVGVLNGSTWTITVELQFYALVPALYALFRVRVFSPRWTNGVLVTLLCIFCLMNRIYVGSAPHHAHELWFKLIGVSFLPWFYMFLVGVLFQKNCERFLAWFGGRWVVLFVAYCMLEALGSGVLRWNLGNGNTLGVPLFLALAIVTFAAAFTCPALSDRLLRRNDISYGVYVYHMPIVNLLLVVGLGGSVTGFLLAISATLVCACLSWKAIEKPALAWKKHPLYQHEAPDSTASRRVSV